MSGFDRLHPALKHHIVNSLGFSSLRPLQEEAIDPILDGENVLLIAPTAGGKTEAAMFPVFSRMLEQDWRRLSVAYVCPIKALLNNLEPRLRQYAGYLGRRVEIWHGDVKSTQRRKILRDPPDILLTTPESLEVILTSPRSRASGFLADLRTIVVDEIHAFAGDDRGWHLMAVLERVQRKSGREIQRLGLSATVGNPDELLAWLAGTSKTPGRVIAPKGDPKNVDSLTEITLDYVGHLNNAATVISRLHRGEKRLVFCDSRYRVEKLAARLRQLKVDTYVSHSSLSADERRRSEEAFAEKSDCVIVATSTLELGIDVGDLDRVIQIEYPSTVASFLQRLGRTGRRPGSSRNCLFLTTAPGSFTYAAGLIQLWSEGRVEAVQPPPAPHHVIVQQLLGVVMQEWGLPRNTWSDWIGQLTSSMKIGRDEVQGLIQHMLETGYLDQDGEVLQFGPETEHRWGRKNYMELCSVFASEPLFHVFYGNVNLGSVHPVSFFVRGDAPPVLLLAGRSWKVILIEWNRGRVFVEPVQTRGRSQWLGGSTPLSYDHCQAVRRVLLNGEIPATLTRRGEEIFAECRTAFDWLEADTTALLEGPDGRIFWNNFAGIRANAMLSTALGHLVDETKRPNNLGIAFTPGTTSKDVERTLTSLGEATVGPDWVPIDPRALSSLKFAEAMPPDLASTVLKTRGADVPAVEATLAERRVIVVVAESETDDPIDPEEIEL